MLPRSPQLSLRMLPTLRLAKVPLPAALVVAGLVLIPLKPAPSHGPSAELDSTLIAGYRWRNIGPDRGGRSIAVTGVKGRPNEAYFGAVGGGLWKTTDA